MSGRSGTPSCTDVGVLALCPDRYGGPSQVRHQILPRLARRFRTVWVEPTPGWREMWLSGEARPPAEAVGEPSPALHVVAPSRFLPQLYRPAAPARWSEMLRLRRAAAVLQRHGCSRIVLYLWRPEYGSALDRIEHAFSCYHIDDEYSFSDTETGMDPLEAALLRRVDAAIIHSPGLLAKKGHLNPHTHQVSNGVNYAAYAAKTHEPADLAQIPRPRIGYVGVVKPQLDLDLLAALARAHAEWSFVLVGPRGHFAAELSGLEALVALPNVHELGARPVSELPAYTGHMDVGLLPYKVNDYTRYIYPLKLHEYLATGLPCVGSPIRSLEDFRDRVPLASSLPEWESAIAQCLSPQARGEAERSARQATARTHDWNTKVEEIAAVMAEGLGLPPFERGGSATG